MKLWLPGTAAAVAPNTGVGGFRKMIAPREVGAWVSPGSFSIGTTPNLYAHDVFRWWLVPVGLAVGASALVATTWVLRWSLGFAKLRRPPPTGYAS